MRIFAAVLALLMLVPVAAFAAKRKAPAPQEITVRTPDGWQLKGTYYPGRPGAPVALLLHKLGSNRSEFTGLAKELNPKGFNVVEYDARGHGESTIKDGKKVIFESFSDKDFENMTIDIGAVLDYLHRDKKIGKVPVGLVGASIQSSTGLIYASRHPEVKALVMLSPGLDYHNIDTVAPMKEYGDRPLFIAASIEDAASYKAAKELDGIAQGPKKKVILSDAGHGAQMFLKEPKLMDQITDWLTANLK